MTATWAPSEQVFSRPVTSLGHQVARRVSWEGPKFIKLCPTHFSTRGEKILGGFSSLVTDLVFSNAGELYSEKRANLAVRNFAILILKKMNLHLGMN